MWRSGDSMQDLLLPPTKCVLKVKLGSSGLAVGVSLRCFRQIIPDSWERTGVSGRQEWEWKYRLKKRAGLFVFVLDCHSSLQSSMLPHPPPHISQKVSQSNLFPLLCFEGGIWSIRKSGMSSSIAQAIKSCKVFDFPEHQLWTLDDRILFFTRLCGIKWDIVNTPHTRGKTNARKESLPGRRPCWSDHSKKFPCLLPADVFTQGLLPLQPFRGNARGRIHV